LVEIVWLRFNVCHLNPSPPEDDIKHPKWRQSFIKLTITGQKSACKT